ncbi:MAG: hypothetical protein AMJ70_02545 [Dehalococcoidia bacterium SG8_51_3]|nr:MAG: hypothetical protein AMJ70_02545 [Dehalococcoidia bacterium SG8_51_3]
MTFIEKLTNSMRKNGSLLCVGLDPDQEKMPGNISVAEFNRAIIEATSDLACAYKLNFAFYEALGDDGMSILKQTRNFIPDNIPVIGDAKRGDIGNTARAYARAIFNHFDFDAATVSPYLGYDSIEPFLQYQERGVLILCRTSNASAVDFQALTTESGDNERLPLFAVVARRAGEWNAHGNIGLVVGATYPDELKAIREQHPDMPLLIPGIGTQGGDLALTVRYGVDRHGEKAIINSSRQILYASKGKDFAEAARQAAAELKERINRHIKETIS